MDLQISDLKPHQSRKVITAALENALDILYFKRKSVEWHNKRNIKLSVSRFCGLKLSSQQMASGEPLLKNADGIWLEHTHLFIVLIFDEKQ